MERGLKHVPVKKSLRELDLFNVVRRTLRGDLIATLLGKDDQLNMVVTDEAIKDRYSKLQLGWFCLDIQNNSFSRNAVQLWNTSPIQRGSGCPLLEVFGLWLI